jgi:hypothetical protein
MTGQQTLFFRVALGLAAGVVSVLLVSLPRLQTISNRRFDRLLFTSFAGSRLGIFGLVFLALRIAPRGDVQAYYMQQAEWVLRGLLPYRDFVSSYAPLHPYLDAGLISLWHTPLAIMLFSVLAELLLLPLWMRAGREFLPEGNLRGAALLYLASPISLQFVTIDGQDNVVIAVLIAFALLLVLRSHVAAAGAALGASVSAFKFLPLLYAPVFLAAVPRRWRLLLGAVLVCGAAYGGFALLHAPILTPLSAEGGLRTAGNLPYVIETIFGVTLPARLTDGCLLLVLLGIFAAAGRAAYRAEMDVRMRALTSGMAAATLALLVLSKKSWPPYLVLALFPVCLLAREESGSRLRNGLRVAGFALFSLIAVAEHSYWSSIFAQFSSAEFHARLSSGHAGVRVLVAVELLLVAGYLGLLWEAMRRLLFRKSVAT